MSSTCFGGGQLASLHAEPRPLIGAGRLVCLDVTCCRRRRRCCYLELERLQLGRRPPLVASSIRKPWRARLATNCEPLASQPATAGESVCSRLLSGQFNYNPVHRSAFYLALVRPLAACRSPTAEAAERQRLPNFHSFMAHRFIALRLRLVRRRRQRRRRRRAVSTSFVHWPAGSKSHKDRPPMDFMLSR